jgi:hypothetical protein
MQLPNTHIFLRKIINIFDEVAKYSVPARESYLDQRVNFYTHLVTIEQN